MKYWLFTVIFLALAFPGQSMQKTVADPIVVLSETLSIYPLEKDVYRIVHRFPWSANSLLIRFSQEEFLLVDTPWENTATELLHKWILELEPLAQLTVINTHFHRDNLGGNDYLVRAGIPVYGSTKTIELLADTQGSGDRSSWMNNPEYEEFYQVFELTPLVAPTQTFVLEDGLELEIANQTIQIFWPGPGHTYDNVVVYFPDKKLLFGGCLIKALESQNPGNLRDAFPELWPGSIQKVMKKYPETHLVIPGHGAPGGPELLPHTIAVITQFLEDRK